MSIVFTANTVRPCKVLRRTPFIHVHGLSCNISSMRRSVSSPDETLRRELKIRRCSGVFLTNFKVFHLVMKHCVECLILLLKQNDLEGEIKDAKMSSFHLISKHSLNINFLCIFLVNYE